MRTEVEPTEADHRADHEPREYGADLLPPAGRAPRDDDHEGAVQSRRRGGVPARKRVRVGMDERVIELGALAGEAQLERGVQDLGTGESYREIARRDEVSSRQNHGGCGRQGGEERTPTRDREKAKGI